MPEACEKPVQIHVPSAGKKHVSFNHFQQRLFGRRGKGGCFKPPVHNFYTVLKTAGNRLINEFCTLYTKPTTNTLN